MSENVLEAVGVMLIGVEFAVIFFLIAVTAHLIWRS